MARSGPLGRAPAGSFNAEGTLYLEPTPKRVRVIVGGETIADSRRVMMLHESGHQPVYYFPSEDVRSEFLEPSDREDEEVYVHPRDPYTRVDLLRSDRHVRVLLDGAVLADTRDAVALFETGLPTRWYLPLEDVLAELEPSDTVTRCPYKGTASYYSVGEATDLVWYYPEPFAEVGRIAGLVCFFNERVDLELDGELQERPVSASRH